MGLDPAATPPAEASGVSGAVPTVRKEKGVVFMRDRVRIVRSGRGVARRKHKVVKTIQNEASLFFFFFLVLVLISVKTGLYLGP